MDQSDKDQNLASLRDGLPPIWWSLYRGCRQVGFDEWQSFRLVQTFILSQNPNGIRPPDGPGPGED